VDAAHGGEEENLTLAAKKRENAPCWRMVGAKGGVTKMIVSKEDLFCEACKIAAEVVMIKELNVPKRMRQGCVVSLGNCRLGVVGLFASPVVIESSDWMNDGRISVHGPEGSVLSIAKNVLVKGPFVANLFYKEDKNSFDCFFQSDTSTGYHELKLYYDPKREPNNRSIYALFQSKVLMLKA